MEKISRIIKKLHLLEIVSILFLWLVLGGFSVAWIIGFVVGVFYCDIVKDLYQGGKNG